MTRVKASQNKARSKNDERDVARLLGGRRHLADSGGPEDCEHPWMCIQVKGGLRVATDSLREGVASAKAGAVGTGKVPVCVLVDRSGTRIRRYVVLDIDDWIAWNGPTAPALNGVRKEAHES